jgi:putative heme-binding domain-containing protein
MIFFRSALLVVGCLGLSRLFSTHALAEPLEPAALRTLPGFKVEILKAAEPATEGSWISIAEDPQGRLLLGGERGDPITRVTIKEGRVIASERLTLPISEVMGMLFAFDSLYVHGRGRSADGRDVYGLFRCRSTKPDGQFDKVELLREWRGGGGDHGAHTILLNPDGRHLDILCGNFCDIPSDLLPSSPHRNYADDLVLPRSEDANGFGAGRKPPGGFIVRMDPDGKHCELVASGQRNTYSVARNPDGELFGFDSDFEGDWGLPWYRPIRVCHLTSGSDFGFREGAGKWPEYYPDSLPGAVNVGIGCPTGVAFGTGAKFPSKYQKAFFVQDWSYGRILAVHLRPEGSSYVGSLENFLVPASLSEKKGRSPFNLTALLIARDGTMYFTLGGRRTAGALYRVSYVGDEPTAPVVLQDDKGSKARALRRQLEGFHDQVDPQAVDFLWPHLGSDDRFLRYAARIALERQPSSAWKSRALAETDAQAAMTALLGLARLGADSREPWQALRKFPLDGLSTESLQLEKLRVVQVALSRGALPTPELAAALIAELSPAYPAKSIVLNRELCQVLLALKAPGTIERTLDLLAAAVTQEEQIAYLFHLRTISDGWNPTLRRRYLSWWSNQPKPVRHPPELLRWFDEAGRAYGDGASYPGYLVKIRQEAIAQIPTAELPAYRSVIDTWAEPLHNLRKPKKQRGYVQEWKIADLEAELKAPLTGRSFAQGQDALASAQCLLCHKIGDEGGSVGPDLTSIGSRFSRRDILESIIDPSKVISEQYVNTEFTLQDGTLVVGRLVAEDIDKIVVRPSMLAPEMRTHLQSDVKSRESSRVSPMPPGLISVLNRQELLDLLAYLEAGGKKDSPVFRK